MLKNILPPKESRPYFGGGIFYDEAPYGQKINSAYLGASKLQMLKIGDMGKKCHQEMKPSILSNLPLASFLISSLSVWGLLKYRQMGMVDFFLV
jgi:hypothetical protein